MRPLLAFFAVLFFSCSIFEDEEVSQIDGLIDLDSDSFLENFNGYNILVFDSNTVKRDLNIFSDEIAFNYRIKSLYVREPGFNGTREWLSSSYYPFSENISELEYFKQYDQDFEDCGAYQNVCDGKFSCLDRRSEFDFNIKTKILSNSSNNIEFGVILKYECRNGEGALNSPNTNFCINGAQYYFKGNIFNLSYEGYEANADSTEVISNYGNINIKSTSWYSNSLDDLNFGFDDVVEMVNEERESLGGYVNSNNFEVEFKFLNPEIYYSNKSYCMNEGERNRLYYDDIDELIANATKYFF